MAWLIPLAVGTATGVLSGFGVGGGTLLLGKTACEGVTVAIALEDSFPKGSSLI